MKKIDADFKKDASDESEVERRKFLAHCGRFAIATPPVITLLMSTSLTSKAIAGSGGAGKHPNNGYGNGGGDGIPGGSGKNHNDKKR